LVHWFFSVRIFASIHHETTYLFLSVALITTSLLVVFIKFFIAPGKTRREDWRRPGTSKLDREDWTLCGCCLTLRATFSFNWNCDSITGRAPRQRAVNMGTFARALVTLARAQTPYPGVTIILLVAIAKAFTVRAAYSFHPFDPSFTGFYDRAPSNITVIGNAVANTPSRAITRRAHSVLNRRSDVMINNCGTTVVCPAICTTSGGSPFQCPLGNRTAL